ncbi:MAG: methionyl-tRNA formyltransferase, partial [Candidatus Margulisbacteria bacterium]|nr:methionyl-tRNA formyltransferase [Candidatus Margulisiibacteriota bacterium]
MRLIFMGTPEPAAKVLQALIAAGHEIAAVVTQPDRPSGRGQKLAFSAVKELALQNNLPLEQPEKIKGNKVFAALIKSLAPEVIVVVAYGKILPREILDIPKFGCLNVHASLLPKYRGAAP